MYWFLSHCFGKYNRSLLSLGSSLIFEFQNLRNQLGSSFFSLVKNIEWLIQGKIVASDDDLGFKDLFDTTLLAILKIFPEFRQSKLYQLILP